MAGSGHIDIVGALLLVVSAAALGRRWRATAAVGLGLAIAVKLLPIVLLPLYWKRVRIRDAALAAAVVGLLYMPFLNHGRIPIGSLGTYDPAFINHNYTLLFPLKAYWDNSATVIDQGMYNLPVGNGSAELVAVKYPAEGGGHTPGDTWELYVGKDNRAEYLVYHRGGPKKPSLLFATWAGHKKAGPLLISTDHRGMADDKPIRVFYSDVSVKVTGSDTWVDAK